MATPVLETGWTTPNSGGATATSLTVTVPSGLAEGDLWIIIAGDDTTDGTNDWDAHADFAETLFAGDTTSDSTMQAYTKTAGASESSVTIGHSGGSAELWAFSLRISGVAATPINQTQATAGQSSGNSLVITGVTPDVADALVLYAMCYDGGDSTFSNATSGWTQEDTVTSGTGSQDASGSFGTLDTSPAIDTYSGTTTVTIGTSDGSAGLMLAIAPSGGSTTYDGLADFTGGATVVATGLATYNGTSALTGGASLTTTGIATFSGLSALSGGGALTGSGLRTAGGVSALTGGGSLAAAGATIEVIDRVVASEEDTAEERKSTGDTVTVSTDLELIYDGYDQYVGVRFTNIVVPKYAIITAAYLSFHAKTTDSTECNLTIDVEAVDDASIYAAGVANYDVSGRSYTTAPVDWSGVEAWSALEWYDSPSIVSLITAVTSRPGWISGNDIAFVIDGDTGDLRRADAYVTDKEPKLHIEYSIGGKYDGSFGTGDITAESGHAEFKSDSLTDYSEQQARLDSWMSGITIYNGLSSLTGGASLTATGLVTVSGLCALTGGGTLTGDGLRTVGGVSDLNATGSLTGTGEYIGGSTTHDGLCALTGGATLTASGLTTFSGISGLTAGGTLTGTGEHIAGATVHDGLCALVGGGALTASGSAIYGGVAAFAAAGTLTATEAVGLRYHLATYDPDTFLVGDEIVSGTPTFVHTATIYKKQSDGYYHPFGENERVVKNARAEASEKLTNTSFETDLSGWTYDASHFEWVSPGEVSKYGTGSEEHCYQAITSVVGKIYHVEFEVTAVTLSPVVSIDGVYAQFGDVFNALGLVNSGSLVFNSVGVKSFDFIATATSHTFGFSGYNATFKITDYSVTETLYFADNGSGVLLDLMPLVVYQEAATNLVLTSDGYEDWTPVSCSAVLDETNLLGSGNGSYTFEDATTSAWGQSTRQSMWTDGIGVVKWWIAKDISATHVSQLVVMLDDVVIARVQFAISTGDYYLREPAVVTDIKVIDEGDWWVVIHNVVDDIDGLMFNPASHHTLPPDGTASVTAVGKIAILNVEFHANKTIEQVEHLGPIFTTGSTAATDEIINTYPAANWSNSEGPIQIIHDYKGVDEVILNNDGVPILYVTSDVLYLDDGTNTTSIAYATDGEHKIAIALDASGSEMRLNVDGTWAD